MTCDIHSNVHDLSRLDENIVMDEPEGFGIWIGPAQQSDSIDLCAAYGNFDIILTCSVL